MTCSDFYSEDKPPSKRKAPRKKKTEGCSKRCRMELENKFNIVSGAILPIPPIKDVHRMAANRATSFLLRGPDVRGKFHPEKAISLGITPGKNFGLLASGKSVVNSKGETVHPHQVMNPKVDGFLLLVVDCPSVDDIPSIIEDGFYGSYYATPEREGGTLRLIIHMLGNGVIHSREYREWMSRFGTEVKHCISLDESKQLRPVDQISTRVQRSLNAIDPEIYVYPRISTTNFVFPLEWGLSKNYAISTDLMIYKLDTTGELSHGKCLDLKTLSRSFLEDKINAQKLNMYNEMCSDIRKIIEEKKSTTEDFTDDLFVCTLGTGSASPSLSRNVSANLVCCGDLTLLLDCGEGTGAQMARIFGSGSDLPYDLKHVFETLKMIYISHAHADHHMGLTGVLEMRKRHFELTKTPPPDLYIISPVYVNNFLNELCDACNISIPEVHIMDLNKFYSKMGNSGITAEALENMQRKLNLQNLKIVPVNHCRQSTGIVLRFKNGRSIAYSGDCRPSLILSREAQDCDIFIHEATFEDTSFGLCEAIKKKHCTSAEALKVVNKARCKLAILTHFSQRYPLVPPLVATFDRDECIKAQNNPYVSRNTITSVASDFMCLKLSQAWRLPYYYDILKLIKDNYRCGDEN